MKSVGKVTLNVMGNAKWYNSYLLDTYSPFIKGNILEIGFGTGNYSKLLSKYGHLTAIEINREYIKDIKKDSKNISFGYGDIEKGEYFFKKGEKFQTVICLNVLEHINNDADALNNIGNLLQDDGSLIMLVPAHQMLFSKFDKLIGHFRRYSKNSLINVFGKTKMEILSVKHFNWLGALGWFILMKIFGRKSLPRKGVSIFDKMARFALLIEKIVEPPFGLSLIVVARKTRKQY